MRGMIGDGPGEEHSAVPPWTRTVALIHEHAAKRAAISEDRPDAPSVNVGYLGSK
jgi:hypothetical protein